MQAGSWIKRTAKEALSWLVNSPLGLKVLSIFGMDERQFFKKLITGTKNDPDTKTLMETKTTLATEASRALIEEIKKGAKANYDLIKKYLNEGAIYDTNTKSLLILAFYNNWPGDIIKELINRGENVNYVEYSTKKTPLILATELRYDKEIVALLITKGASANVESNTGDTPLLNAIKSKYSSETIALLIKEGSNVNAYNSVGSTPLSCAIMYRHTSEIIALLLKKGANPKSKQEKKYSIYNGTTSPSFHRSQSAFEIALSFYIADKDDRSKHILFMILKSLNPLIPLVLSSKTGKGASIPAISMLSEDLVKMLFRVLNLPRYCLKDQTEIEEKTCLMLYSSMSERNVPIVIKEEAPHQEQQGQAKTVVGVHGPR